MTGDRYWSTAAAAALRYLSFLVPRFPSLLSHARLGILLSSGIKSEVDVSKNLLTKGRRYGVLLRIRIQACIGFLLLEAKVHNGSFFEAARI